MVARLKLKELTEGHHKMWILWLNLTQHWKTVFGVLPAISTRHGCAVLPLRCGSWSNPAGIIENACDSTRRAVVHFRQKRLGTPLRGEYTPSVFLTYAVSSSTEQIKQGRSRTQKRQKKRFNHVARLSMVEEQGKRT